MSDAAAEAIADTGGVNAAHRREMQGRVGHVDGQVVRSFHCRFGSVKAGQSPSRGWQHAIAYASRSGKYAESGEDAAEGPDLQYLAGDPAALWRACEAIEATARRRKGRTAERVLVKEIIELPSDVDDEQARWAAAAEEIVAHWKARGHEAIAAVHLHGEERDHPHLHVLVAARPIRQDGTVDRTRRLMVGKTAVKEERVRRADLINEACGQEVPYNAGTLREIGLDRDGKGRIPTGTFFSMRAKIRAAREAGDQELAEKLENEMHEMSKNVRKEYNAVHQERWKEQKARREALAKAGLWPRDSSLFRQAIARAEEAEAEAARNNGRAEEAAAKAVEIDKERDQALAQAEVAESRVRELTEKQAAYLTDRHELHDVELPDLTTEEGQAEAWENLRAWDLEERKRREAEAGERAEAEVASWPPRQVASAEEVAEALTALDDAAGLDEAMRARRRTALADAVDGLIEDDPAGSADTVYLDVPDDREAIALMCKTPGVQYDLERRLHWVREGHENAEVLRAHFGEVRPPRREREGLTYLAVPDLERDLAVDKGARYDRAAGRFMVPEGSDPARFEAWMGTAAEAALQADRRVRDGRRKEAAQLRPDALERQEPPAEGEGAVDTPDRDPRFDGALDPLGLTHDLVQPREDEVVQQLREGARNGLHGTEEETERARAEAHRALEEAGLPCRDVVLLISQDSEDRRPRFTAVAVRGEGREKVVCGGGLTAAEALKASANNAPAIVQAVRPDGERVATAAEELQETAASVEGSAKPPALTPEEREKRERKLRREYRRAGLTRRNALRDSRDAAAGEAFREEAAGRLARTEERLAGLREEARALGVDLEPRRQATEGVRDGGKGD